MFEYLEDTLVCKSSVFLWMLILLGTSAFAQLPSGNVFVGYSYLSADLLPGNRANLNGWNASIEGKILPFIGVVADFSGHYGTQGVPFLETNADVSQHDFLFGPRVSVSVRKLRPFAHALFGASHLSQSEFGISNSATAFAYSLGGGLDYRLVRMLAWRVQADFLQTRFFSTSQNDVRISTGLVVHF